MLTLVFSTLFFTGFITAQSRSTQPFYYQSPVPGAKMVRPESGIILKTHRTANEAKLTSGISIRGSFSGEIGFDQHRTDDKNTILLRPAKYFAWGEKVTVTISSGIFDDNTETEDYSFSFYIMKKPVKAQIIKEYEKSSNPYKNSWATVSRELIDEYNLPDNFPEYEITQKNDPSPGYFFVSPLKWGDNSLYIIIMDNEGFPVFYRNNTAGAYDFKLQPNGELTYFHSGLLKYIRLNSKMDLTGFYAMGNGYSTDLHECNVTAGNHVWMLGYDPQLVDMDTVVEGGQTGATVTGLIVQEQDENGNVVFQWRSWDHYEITDASPWVPLTAESIDYVHGNTIEIVDDNSILISCRNMNEITKINRNTGEIIWRFGGPACQNNMFEFTNDTIGFKMQHDVRYHGNNLISLFNNGSGTDPDPWSSSVFYAIDDENMTATMMERYYNDPAVFGDIMGNCQLLDNGNIVTGWGRADNGIETTEFSPDGTSEMQITIPYTVYRSFKFQWQNDVFSKSTDTLDFSVYYHDSLTKEITIGNNHSRAVTITGFHHHTDNFSLANDSLIPVTLQPGEEATFRVKFGPAPIGEYSDVLSLYEDIETDSVIQRIACQVYLQGKANEDNSIFEPEANFVNVSPNPGTGKFTICTSADKLPLMLELTDLSGNVIKRFNRLNKEKLTVNLSAYPGGIYFLKAMNTKKNLRQTLKLIKISN